MMMMMMMMMINKCCQDIFTAAGRTMSPLHAVSLIPNVGEKKKLFFLIARAFSPTVSH